MISTRKIENIAKRLGIDSLSASEISEINKGLDDMVIEFSKHGVWKKDIRCLVQKDIRKDKRIENMAVIVIKAANTHEQQKILAIEPIENEYEDTYTALFRNLQNEE